MEMPPSFYGCTGRNYNNNYNNDNQLVSFERPEENSDDETYSWPSNDFGRNSAPTVELGQRAFYLLFLPTGLVASICFIVAAPFTAIGALFSKDLTNAKKMVSCAKHSLDWALGGLLMLRPNARLGLYYLNRGFEGFSEEAKGIFFDDETEDEKWISAENDPNNYNNQQHYLRSNIPNKHENKQWISEWKELDNKEDDSNRYNNQQKEEISDGEELDDIEYHFAERRTCSVTQSERIFNTDSTPDE